MTRDLVWGSDAFYNAARKRLHKMTDDTSARDALEEVVATGPECDFNPRFLASCLRCNLSLDVIFGLREAA